MTNNDQPQCTPDTWAEAEAADQGQPILTPQPVPESWREAEAADEARA